MTSTTADLRRADDPDQPGSAGEARPGLTAARRDPAADGSIRNLVQAWLASRALIAAVALLLAVVEGRTITDMVSNWDVQHFTSIAEGGYWAQPNGQLMAFFPGLPILLRLFLDLGVPVAVSGVVLSVAGSWVAAVALYRLGGLWAAGLWLFAPVAVFTTVPYTESLFCACAFWAWERARADRWAAAAVLTAGACTFRVSGLFLLGALVVMLLTARGLSWRDRGRRVAWLAIPAAVLFAFAAYLHSLTNSWTAWFTAQSTGWVRQFTWPWDSFLNTIPAILPGAYADHPWWAAVFRGEMISMAVGVVVVVWCLATWRWAEASWVGVQVLAFSLSYWFFSVNRALLLWFPLWIMLGQLLGRRPRRTAARVVHGGGRALFLVGMLAAMLWWCWLFFTGHWAS